MKEIRLELNLDIQKDELNNDIPVEEIIAHIKWLFETYGSRYIIVQSIK